MLPKDNDPYAKRDARFGFACAPTRAPAKSASNGKLAPKRREPLFSRDFVEIAGSRPADGPRARSARADCSFALLLAAKMTGISDSPLTRIRAGQFGQAGLSPVQLQLAFRL